MRGRFNWDSEPDDDDDLEERLWQRGHEKADEDRQDRDELEDIETELTDLKLPY